MKKIYSRPQHSSEEFFYLKNQVLLNNNKKRLNSLKNCNKPTPLLKIDTAWEQAELTLFRRGFEFSKQGKTVVLDSVCPELLLKYKAQQQLSNPIRLVCVVCPFLELANRLLNRNVNAEQTGDLKIASIMEDVSMLHCVEFPHDFIDEFHKRSLQAFENDITAIDGIEDVLKNLNVPFCIGSNSSLKVIESCLSMTGLLHYFQGRIFSAYELQRWKTDPFLFQFAADTMGVPVEDSPCGVQAAQAASMFTLGYAALGIDGKIDPRSQILEKEGAIVISDMRDVLTYLPK